MQRGSVGMVLRQIPSRLMTLEEIGLPPAIKDLLYKPRGLILVTGPTGSGKTTTLASMINIINETRDATSSRSKTRSSTTTPTRRV
jgi:twitching motility protein PilT